MENYSKKLIVKNDRKIKLSKINSSFHGKFESQQDALAATQKNLAKIEKLQYSLYAENKHSLLIVLQGLDGAGKDGVIRHVLAGMNPQGCTVTPFKQPSLEESAHDFLWRAHLHAPRKGTVAIFNRSHYEDVLITRVHKTISKQQCSRRYSRINDFEKLLVEENQTTILKFYLHISKEEQLARFKQRLKDPSRHWKISEADYAEREFWSRYMTAYEEMLSHTHTTQAPWFIIPSDRKWFRNLAISQIIVTALENLKLRKPQPTVDIAKIRRKYHAAALGEK